MPPIPQFCATLGFPRWNSVDSGCVSIAGDTALHQHNPVPPLESAFVFIRFYCPPPKTHPTTGKKLNQNKSCLLVQLPKTGSDKLQHKCEGCTGFKVVPAQIPSNCCGTNSESSEHLPTAMRDPLIFHFSAAQVKTLGQMFKMPLSQFSIITATSIESNMIIFLDVGVSCPSVSETADKVALR